MAKKLLRVFIALIGGLIGCWLVVLADNMVVALGGNGFQLALYEWGLVLLYVLAGLLFAIIFFIFSPKIQNALARLLRVTEDTLTQMPVVDVFFAVLGLILGLLVALFITQILSLIPVPWLVTPISIGLYILCGYLGVSIAVKRRNEIHAPGWLQSGMAKRGGAFARPKILDTSVIIDGRICDICQTGVMEGEIVVPGFVLGELRHIADSSDGMKRCRGRRGLDILQRMQKELAQPVRIEERDYEDIAEVDAKLLKLAQDLGGVVVTNDYNLNKVAGVQRVPVFNINELANAIKPVVLPGEEMHVAIVKEGRENNQGVAYLDDGTMIVVEGGKRLIGEQLDVTVTSVLQTAAGRMMFAKIRQ